jgi:hypothetical protein
MERQSALPLDRELAEAINDVDRPRASMGFSRGLVSYLVALLAIGMALTAWSLATPLGAAPDESHHIAQAAAIVRGQFDAPEVPGGVGQISIVNVPEWVYQARFLDCYVFHPTVSAGCAPSEGHSTKTVAEVTQFSHYPPIYYLIVGAPSLVFTGSRGLYAMRLAGDLLNAGLIALGLVLLGRYHPRRFPLLGALAALSPMVLFVTSVVNDSGMETAAAFAAWCAGLCLIGRTEIPKGLTWGVAVSFVMLILSRPISPINAGIIAMVLAVLAGWHRTGLILRAPSFRPAAFAIVGGLATAGVFLLIGGIPSLLGIPEKHPLSFAGRIWVTLQLTGPRLRDTVGRFGWLDTPVTLFVVSIWATVVSALCVFAVAVSARCRRALPLLALSIVALPLLLESQRINQIGPYWQGRYWLPLVMGVPLVASSLKAPARHRHGRTLPLSLQLVGLIVVDGALIVAQVAAFLTALHRYQTGLGAAPGTPVQWVPPGGEVTVVALFVAGQLLLMAFVAWKLVSRRPRQQVRLAPSLSG